MVYLHDLVLRIFPNGKKLSSHFSFHRFKCGYSFELKIISIERKVIFVFHFIYFIHFMHAARMSNFCNLDLFTAFDERDVRKMFFINKSGADFFHNLHLFYSKP